MEEGTLGELILLPIMRALAWLYYLLPWKLKQGLSGALAMLLRSLRFRESVILENLHFAYPGDNEEARKLRDAGYREAYRHLGYLFPELLMLLGPMKHHVRKNARLENMHYWEEARKKGKGVLILASHVGNWEIMSARGSLSGIDLLMVTKRLKPEWLHQAIENGRSRYGVQATYEPRTFRDILTHLRSNGTVGIVLDQYTGPPVGVRVPFFGQPVGTHSVLALLAKRTGAVVIPVKSRRQENGEWVVVMEPPVEWRPAEIPEEEIAANTAAYAEIIERHVRENPGQWLWTHRRFKGDLSPLRAGEWKEHRARA